MVPVAATESYVEPTYGNWRKPRRAGIGKWGLLPVLIVIGGMISVQVSWQLFGWQTAAGVGIVALSIAGLLGFKDRHDMTPAEHLMTRFGFMTGRMRRRNVYRSGPLGYTEAGTFQLPGLLAGSKVYEFTDTYDRPFALLNVPSRGHYTVVFSVQPDGSALVDPEQIDQWIANWGGFLGSLGAEPGLAGAQAVFETAPDTGARLRREIEGAMSVDAPEVARRVLEDAMREYPTGSAGISAWVTMTYRATVRRGGKPRDPETVGRDLASRLPGLVGRIQATGAGATAPVSAAELCEVLRVAYDPAAETMVEESHRTGEPLELAWEALGPAGHEAGWDYYRHDSAVSRSWSMTGAPRGQVGGRVLQRLLDPHPDIERKRVSLMYRPMDIGAAAGAVESDVNQARARVTSNNRPSARSLAALSAAEATAREEARGAGLEDFGLVVTVSCSDAERLDAASATMETALGPASSLALRRVYGSQDVAFSAALPVGLITSAHTRVPHELRGVL